MRKAWRRRRSRRSWTRWRQAAPAPARRCCGCRLPLQRPPPLPGLEFKVIRPHDMPQLVATGEMDLAITGRDCLTEHLSRFPSSPLEEVADLQRGQFDLAAVASEAVPASDLSGALVYWL